MSIPPAFTLPTWPQIVSFLILFAGPPAAIVIALAARVWRLDKINGPDRLAGERAGELAMIMGIAIFAGWFLIPGIYMSVEHVAPTTRGAMKLTERESVVAASLMQAGGLLVLFLATAVLRPGGLARLGMSKTTFYTAIPIAVAGVIFVLPAVGWLSLLVSKLMEWLRMAHPEKHEMLDILDKTPDRWLKAIVIFTAGILAPMFEELLFRGHLQTLVASIVTRFARRRAALDETPPEMAPGADPPEPASLVDMAIPIPMVIQPLVPRLSQPGTGARWFAVLVASGCFALVHPWWTQAPIFFLADVLGYVYERTGNLWAAIFIHMGFNCTSMVISYYG